MPQQPRYYIRQPGGGVQGPFPLAKIRGWIEQGRVRREMEFSEDGESWLSGPRCPDLFAPVAQEVAPDPVVLVSCPHCAEDIRKGAKKCIHCGEWLRSKSRAGDRGGQPHPRRGHRRKSRRTSLLVVLALVVAGGGTAYYLLTRPPEYERAALEFMDVVDELSRVLSTVYDEDSARTAEPAIRGLMARFTEMESTMSGLDISTEEKQALKDKYAVRRRRNGAELKRHLERIHVDPRVEATLGDALTPASSYFGVPRRASPRADSAHQRGTKRQFRKRIADLIGNPFGRGRSSEGEFVKAVGEPDKTQTVGDSMYWYYRCADGTVQVVISATFYGASEGLLVLEAVNDY